MVERRLSPFCHGLLDCDALVDDLLGDLDALTEEVRRRFGPLTDGQSAWQPSPQKWGVGPCLVHLAQQGSVETFLSEQHRTRALIEESRGLDLDAIRIRSPFASWVKFRSGDALRILVEHEKRHVKQATEVMAVYGFPG